MAAINSCVRLCMWFSLMGSVLLVRTIQTALAITLLCEYEYVKISNKETSGKTCFWAAAIYLLCFIICFIYLRSKPRISLRDYSIHDPS